MSTLVSPRPSSGQPEPKFIIKLGDKYYVTLSVLEYDPNATGANAAQADGAAQIAATFARTHPKLQACQAPAPQLSAYMQTGPGGPTG